MTEEVRDWKRLMYQRVGVVVGLVIFSSFELYLAESSEKASEMIEHLDEGVSGDVLGAIYQEIVQVPDEAVRAELKSKLHSRLDDIFEPRLSKNELEANANPAGNRSGEATESESPPQSDEGSIAFEIQRLQVGQEASADARDAVVAKINQVQDPTVRDRLWRYLEERERAAN